MNVEAILAYSNPGFIIGKGDVIPWHHSGDFKRFKMITHGHALLMGTKTFLGIANNYFANTQSGIVLPGRLIFILGSPRNYIGTDHDAWVNVRKKGYGNDWVRLVHEIREKCDAIGVKMDNLRIILDDAEPKELIARIEMNYPEMLRKTLFVAGGAKVYNRFLPHTVKIHQTIISDDGSDTIANLVKENSNDLVKIDDETVNSCLKHRHLIRTHEGVESYNGLNAHYETLTW